MIESLDVNLIIAQSCGAVVVGLMKSTNEHSKERMR